MKYLLHKLPIPSLPGMKSHCKRDPPKVNVACGTRPCTDLNLLVAPIFGRFFRAVSGIPLPMGRAWPLYLGPSEGVERSPKHNLGRFVRVKGQR
jgi:hypothetical protein